MHTLYKKLQLAAKYNMHADDVRMMIDEIPIIDTQHERDRNTIRIADFELKEESAITVVSIKKSLRVIYWNSNDKQYDASIAGLAWPENEKAVFFSGKVLDP